MGVDAIRGSVVGSDRVGRATGLAAVVIALGGGACKQVGWPLRAQRQMWIRGSTNTALSLDLNSGAAIDDGASAATLAISNLADFAGSAITLDNAGIAISSLTFKLGGSVAFS